MVINTTEIRIGNFLGLKAHPGRKFKIIAVEADHLNYASDGEWQYIPLNFASIKEFGFIEKEIGSQKYYHKGDFYLDLECRFTCISKEGISYTLTEPLKYLHRLQNLYFNVTGKELNS